MLADIPGVLPGVLTLAGVHETTYLNLPCRLKPGVLMLADIPGVPPGVLTLAGVHETTYLVD